MANPVPVPPKLLHLRTFLRSVTLDRTEAGKHALISLSGIEQDFGIDSSRVSKFVRGRVVLLTDKEYDSIVSALSLLQYRPE